MSTPYLGRGAIGFGEESSWGTAVARSHWLRVISASVSRVREKRARPHLMGPGEPSAVRRTHYVARDIVEGSFEVEVGYQDASLLLLKHALGAVATTGTDPYDHALTLSRELPTGLTIEQVIGEKPDGTKIGEVYTGCLITRLVLRVTGTEIMRATIDVIGKTSAGKVSDSSPSFGASDFPVQARFGSTLAWDNLTGKLTEMELTVDNRLTERMLLGDLNGSRPARSDHAEVTMRATRELDETTAYASYLADAEEDAVISFPDSPRDFEITLHNAYADSVDEGLSGAGIQTQTLELRGQGDGTNGGLKIEVTNNADGLNN